MPTLTDQNVPIIGQQIAVLGYLVLPLVQCGCGAPPMQLMGQQGSGPWQAPHVACPQCHNIYRIHSCGTDQTGQIRFGIEVSRMAEA